MLDKQYSRNCPSCNKKLFYPSKKRRDLYIKKSSLCSECSSKKSWKVYNKKRAKKLRKTYVFVCKNCNDEFTSCNPTYNKWCKKCKGLLKNGWKEDCAFEYGEKGKVIKLVHTGKIRKPYEINEINKRRKKKNNYIVWLEKYGKEIADQKLVEFKKKQSLNNKGLGNPMYGKPAPKGSGNGWSGWYKNWYFRSLKELSYMINVIEKNNYKWVTAEGKKYRISYVDETGMVRNYFADFIIEEKYLVEVKPKQLQQIPRNEAKKKGALDYCKQNNLEYKMEESESLDEKEIYQLYIKREIVFNKKSEKKAMIFFVKRGLC